MGLYDAWDREIYFDLNGDGEFDTARNSSERYTPFDEYLVVDGVSWELTVDRHGDGVRLERLVGERPARAALDVGATAPDFEFTHLSGATRRLSDYRGEVVLIDFGAPGAGRATPRRRCWSRPTSASATGGSRSSA